VGLLEGVSAIEKSGIANRCWGWVFTFFILCWWSGALGGRHGLPPVPLLLLRWMVVDCNMTLYLEGTSARERWKSLEFPQLDVLQQPELWSSPQLGTRSEEILGIPMGRSATRWADIFKFLREVFFFFNCAATIGNSLMSISDLVQRELGTCWLSYH
jgi:hypothetical protein